jgi:Antp family protein
MMNSYFEQSGFYGQAAASAGADPSYRFPLGLAGMGVSPYSQHAQPRPQEYDAAAAAAAAAASAAAASPKASGLYSPLNNDSSSVYKSSSTTSSGSGGGGGRVGAAPSIPDPTSVDCKDQTNGYSSLSKELNAWGSGAPGGGASSNGSAPVRPSVCTPDMSRYTPSAVDAAAASARDRWMNSCSLTSASQADQIQQSANHTFYPWMAIAGKSRLIKNYSSRPDIPF